MDVNVDMHWRCRGGMYKHMRHVIDVKVDDYWDNYF